MILPIQYKADWATITLKKQKRIDKSKRRENSKWLNIEYKEGDLVLLNKPGILPNKKLGLPRARPYLIGKVHDHGTVSTIAISMAVTDRVKIRRL